MSKFTNVSFVEEMIINVQKWEEFKGWRFYRVEYKEAGNPYSSYEKSILLPANFDVQKLEKEINECISIGC